MDEQKKEKKGLLSMIRESMTKTGGCCGPGETCCGPVKEEGEEAGKEKEADGSTKDVTK